MKIESQFILFAMAAISLSACHAVYEKTEDSTDDSASDGTDPDTGDSETVGSDTDVSRQMNWVEIPPGTFLMGSPEDERGREPTERLHEVTHVHAYEIATTEVTCAQWSALNAGFEHICDPASCDRTLSAQCDCTDDDCPAPRVTVESAEVWLDALSVASGLPPCYAEGASWPSPLHCPGYRIPTESEWERAARAGDNRATYNGDPIGNLAILSPIAWCGKSGIAQAELRAQPVAQLEPNGFGLYDMIGNVDEVTLWEGVYPDEPVENPYVDAAETIYVARGGDFHAYYRQFEDCRAADRSIRTEGNIYGGLRPVRTLPGSTLSIPEPPDPCPKVDALKPCLGEEDTPPPPMREAAAGERYVDMAAGETAVMLLGASDSVDPFVEVMHKSIGDPEFTRYEVAPGETGLHPAAVAFEILSDEIPDRAAVAVCGETCALYLVSARDESDRRTISLLDNGAVPEWVGPVTDLLFFGDPLEIFVAGSGVARFDGNTWVEEVPPSTRRVLSLSRSWIPANGTAAVAAVGERGLLMLREMGVWTTVDTDLDADLLDASVYFNGDRPVATAVGTDGVLVDTRDADAVTTCRLGDDTLRVIAGTLPSFRVLSDTGRQIIQPPPLSSVDACLGRPVVKGVIGTATLSCGISTNRFYLTEAGLFGDGIFCAID